MSDRSDLIRELERLADEQANRRRNNIEGSGLGHIIRCENCGRTYRLVGDAHPDTATCPYCHHHEP